MEEHIGLLPGVSVRILDDAGELARASAAALTEAAVETVASRGRFALALSGGSTPRVLFRTLADPALPFRARLPWDRIHWFWGDERTVPPDHPESNFRLAREEIFDRVAIDPACIHRIPAELPDAAAAAREYELELARFFAPAPGLPPRFDLVLLGLGNDGHTASLFPQSAALAVTDRFVVANRVDKLDTWRITLTRPVLNGAARAYFLVSGRDKAAILAEVLAGPPRPDDLPAQAVKLSSGELCWWVDRAAASDLAARRAGV